MEIVNLILHYKNLKISAFLDTLDSEKKNDIILAQLKQHGIVSIFSVIYARDFLHHNLMDIGNLLNEKVGDRICSSIMSLNRFNFIKRTITFDDSMEER